MNRTSRYALYFAPTPGSGWEHFGAAWFARVAQAPRRYGFHATLKAPFRLASQITIDDLLSELERYSVGVDSFVLPELEVALLADFLALVPVRVEGRIEAIAADCVQRFDQFRAPLDAAEIAKRQPERLDQRERDMLQRWGYPYVLGLYRFHMSLTGPLAAADSAQAVKLRAEAGKAIAALEPPRVDAICLLEEVRPGSGFRLLRRVAFGR